MPGSPENLRPLTKKGRKQQAREEKRQVRRSQEAQTRRRNVTIGIGAGLGLLAGGAAILSSFGREPNESEVGSTLTLTDTQILDSEVKGLVPQPSEQALWRGPLSYTTEGLRPLDLQDPSSEAIANQRLQNTLMAMGQSKNAVFNETVRFINEHRRIGDLQIIKLDQSRLVNGKRTNASTTQVVVGNNLVWTIGIDEDYVLNNSDSLGLAFALVTEIQHVKNKIAYQNQLSKQQPNLTAKEREAKEEERLSNPDEFLAQEARGLAMQLEAFIFQYGMGYRAPNLQRDAAQLIRLKKAGKDTNSSEWRNYVRQAYLS